MVWLQLSQPQLENLRAPMGDFIVAPLSGRHMSPETPVTVLIFAPGARPAPCQDLVATSKSQMLVTEEQVLKLQLNKLLLLMMLMS